MLALLAVALLLGELLLGSEAEGATSESLLFEEAMAFRFTASETGTIEALRWHTNGVQGESSLVLGVMSDREESATHLPASALGEATHSGKPGESEAIEVGGLSIAVVGGTSYWLVVIPLSGTTHFKRGTTTETAICTAKHATVAALNGSTLANWSLKNHGPMNFAALGTTSGGAVGHVLGVV